MVTDSGQHATKPIVVNLSPLRWTTTDERNTVPVATLGRW